MALGPWSSLRRAANSHPATDYRPLTTDHWPLATGHRPLATDRRAFTLTELLMVVLIVAVVTIATIPMLQPALDSRRIREAARILTTQFASAQSEAVATGHSVGVWMEKILITDPSSSLIDHDASIDLYLCEAPQPYSGDSESSTAVVTVTGTPPTGVPLAGTVTMNNADTGWVGLLHQGDLIRFNNSGPYYYLLPLNPAQVLLDGSFVQTPPPASTVFKITPVDKDDFDSTGVNPAFRHLPQAAFTIAGWTTSYQILRQPIKSAGMPVQLPSGAIVDTYYSGMGNFPAIPPHLTFNSNDANPIEVIFDRTGALDCIYVGGQHYDVTAPLYFLIGKREKVNSITFSNPADQNWADQENLWVSLNPQSGLASPAEVAPVDSSTSPLQQVIASRAFATSAQAMGGK